MHEASIARAIIGSVCKVVAQSGLTRVSKVHLRVGKFTAVVPEALSFAFRYAAEGTPCENAALVIEEIPITFRCEDCQRDSSIEEANLVCPKCNSQRLRLLSGRELLIESVEAE